jgi:hypothetical protein
MNCDWLNGTVEGRYRQDQKKNRSAEGKREVTEPYGSEGETTTQSRNVGS